MKPLKVEAAEQVYAPMFLKNNQSPTLTWLEEQNNSVRFRNFKRHVYNICIKPSLTIKYYDISDILFYPLVKAEKLHLFVNDLIN